MDDDIDFRYWELVRFRRQVVILREDAAYWRHRDRLETAAELERIATLMEDIARDLELTLPAFKRTPPA
jgi:hypothetical protein